MANNPQNVQKKDTDQQENAVEQILFTFIVSKITPFNQYKIFGDVVINK